MIIIGSAYKYACFCLSDNLWRFPLLRTYTWPSYSAVDGSACGGTLGGRNRTGPRAVNVMPLSVTVFEEEEVVVEATIESLT